MGDTGAHECVADTAASVARRARAGTGPRRASAVIWAFGAGRCQGVAVRARQARYAGQARPNRRNGQMWRPVSWEPNDQTDPVFSTYCRTMWLQKVHTDQQRKLSKTKEQGTEQIHCNRGTHFVRRATGIKRIRL